MESVATQSGDFEGDPCVQALYGSYVEVATVEYLVWVYRESSDRDDNLVEHMPKKILKKISREVLGKIVRDGAPDLAEMLIKEYLKGSSDSTILLRIAPSFHRFLYRPDKGLF
mgnify:CR=1 FL=1